MLEWDKNWDKVCWNACTTTVVHPGEDFETTVAEIATIIEVKCGHKPNIRKIVSEGVLLIGYVDDGSTKFDPMSINLKRFGRISTYEAAVRFTCKYQKEFEKDQAYRHRVYENIKSYLSTTP